MEYNLARDALITVSGTQEFSFTQTTKLVEDMSSPVINLYDGDLVVIECIFADRIAIEEIRYYFNSNESQSTVASGILFEYKNESFAPYSTLTTAFTDNYFYSTAPGGINLSPKYIKVTHNIAGLSGTLCGLYVVNDDSVVKFGVEGTTTSGAVSASRGEEYIYTFPIYNNNNIVARANAYVQIEKQDVYLDENIYLGASSAGPWVKINDSNRIIADETNWDYGAFGSNLAKVDNLLQITGNTTGGAWAGIYDYAVYTTRVFKLDNINYATLCLKTANANTGIRIAVDDSDLVETVEVKSLPTKPKDYHAYRTIYTTDNHYYYCADYDIETETYLRKSSGSYGVYYSTAEADGTLSDYTISVNEDRYTAVLNCGSGLVNIFTLDEDFAFVARKTLLDNDATDDPNVPFLFDVQIDSGMGVWLYVYTRVGRDTNVLSSAGYYLIHLDSDLTVTLKLYTDTRDIYGFSIVPESSDIWYTDTNKSTVYLLGSDGSVTQSYSETSNTDNLRGCAACDDGSCWFINGNNLYKLNNSGVLVDYIEDITNTNNLAEIVFVDDDNLVVRDGETIVRLDLSAAEHYYRKVYETSLPYASKFVVVGDYIYVYCTTGYTHILSYVDGTSVYVVGSAVDGVQTIPGIFRVQIEDDISLVNLFPVSTDTVWSNASFNKITTDLYKFSETDYHQLRITLRTNKPYDKYNVPNSISSWETTDAFNNEAGYDYPYEHRWNLHGETNIVVVSGTCVFKGDEDPIMDTYRKMDTYNKWFINATWRTTYFDVQFDYEIPDSNTDDVAIHLRMLSQKYYSLDHCYEAYLIRSSGVMTLYIRAYGYEDPGTYSSPGGQIKTLSTSLAISPVRNFGKLRFRIDPYENYNAILTAYLWDPVTETWTSKTRELYSGGSRWLSLDHEAYYYPAILVESNSDVYIDNFQVNEGIVYWHCDPPKLEEVYIKDCVKINDIACGSYKNVYLKTFVDADDSNYEANATYDYNLKVWWEILEDS